MRKTLAAIAAMMSLATPATAQIADPERVRLAGRAEEGDARAAYRLGLDAYARRDLVEAERWLSLAANEIADAQALLGEIVLDRSVETGAGPELGRALLKEAADRGSLAAATSLYQRYIEGDAGFVRDQARAFDYLLIIADHRRTPLELRRRAEFLAGIMLGRGEGAPKDDERAYRFMVRSSENNYVPAMFSRAAMLASGTGTHENDSEARAWYGRAAQSGQPGSGEALRNLGWMFLTGEGGALDAARGFAYLAIAEAAGTPGASELRQRFADLETPRVKGRSQAIAAEWRALFPAPKSTRAR